MLRGRVAMVSKHQWKITGLSQWVNQIYHKYSDLIDLQFLRINGCYQDKVKYECYLIKQI